MASRHDISIGQRRQMIAEAAYFRAERRGFNGGDAVRDWCEAELEVDTRLRRIEDEQLTERVEEALMAAGKRLAAVRRKLTRLSADARSEWQKDCDKLVALRTALQPKFAELREQGEQAGQKVRDQAEKLRAEMTDLVGRLAAKVHH